jgi:hypothetical protein
MAAVEIIHLKTTRLAEVEPEHVSWLWPGRIPVGKITMLDGDPGNGKSTISLDIAARVSRGLPMPDGAASDLEGPGNVLLLGVEDGLGDTIRPRLDAAGADVNRITAVTSAVDLEGVDCPFTIPHDIDMLGSEIETNAIRLVIVDPLVSFLSEETNSYNDHHIRRALSPVAQLAERTGASFLIIRHLTKAQGGNALYRGGGSIGITAIARSAMVVGVDPENEDQRVLAMTKSNLSARVSSLAYRLESAANGSVAIDWQGESTHTAGHATMKSAAHATRRRTCYGHCSRTGRCPWRTASVRSGGRESRSGSGATPSASSASCHVPTATRSTAATTPGNSPVSAWTPQVIKQRASHQRIRVHMGKTALIRLWVYTLLIMYKQRMRTSARAVGNQSGHWARLADAGDVLIERR